MLQERIETLGSGILTFKDNRVYVLGFNSLDRLNDYHFNNRQCHCSQGIYKEKELNWGKIKDDALFILIKNEVEFKKYYFEVLIKDTIEYKINNKPTTKVYKIRKCKYNNIYNLLLREKKIINDEEIAYIEAYNFDSIDLLKNFFFKKFSTELPLLLFS